LDHVQPDPAQSEDDDIIAHLNLRRIGDRAHACRHPAADIAGGIKRRIGADFCHRNFGQDNEIRKGRATHIVIDCLALIAHPACTIGHQPLALRFADSVAQIGFARQAHFALAAFGCVERDDMIIGCNRGHSRAHFAHDPRALMAEHAGEDPLAIQSIERVSIGVTNAGRHNFDQHFACLGPFQIQLHNFERFLCFKSDSCACLHWTVSSNSFAAIF